MNGIELHTTKVAITPVMSRPCQDLSAAVFSITPGRGFFLRAGRVSRLQYLYLMQQKVIERMAAADQLRVAVFHQHFSGF